MSRAIRSSTPPKAKALVVGVSDYPVPITKLPAVAADVREIAKLLSSKQGAFQDNVTVLTEKYATQKAVLASLKDTFGSATTDDTVFVYLAGHGDVDTGAYFFIPHDADIERVPTTAVPLTTIRDLFEATKSKQVCLWLDFCHSGGIIPRHARVADDWAVVKRTLQVVRGQGRVIYAACSPSQSAYESQTVGHGLFTHALLEGLKGKAALNGEVTVSSLFDFIDRQVGSHRQRPEFFGHLQGRMVLMHSVSRTSKQPSGEKSAKTKTPKKRANETWVMLGDSFFQAKTVRHNADNSMLVQIVPASSEEDARLSAFRPTQYGGAGSIAFACENDAANVRVREAASEVVGGEKTWSLGLSVDQQSFGNSWMDMSVGINGKNFSADDIAKLRAGRILLNDPPPPPAGQRGFDQAHMLEAHIEGMNDRFKIRDCPIRSIYAARGQEPAWKLMARLRAVYCLKASGTVEHIFELTIGALRAGKVQVRFRGQRHRQYSNREPIEISIEGDCPLE